MESSAYSCRIAPAAVQLSQFRGAFGFGEYHLLIRPTECARVETQLDWIDAAYRDALAARGLHTGTVIFRRFFCSDLANQVAALAAGTSSNRDLPDEICAISWVQQPPAPPAKVALWAYHVLDPASEFITKWTTGPTLTWQRNSHAHLWTTGLVPRAAGSAEEQTRDVLQQYAALLDAHNLSLARHVLRTWLFVRDIGTDYEGVVAARRELFREHGLTPRTHFIASTGIEGGCADPHARLMLDAYAVAGVQPDQITFLAAPDHLGPTHAYGVTFERATRIAWRDRAHIVVSGTASIDPQGRVLHAGDVLAQLDRALDNVAALLHQGGAALADLAVLVAYVRDASDRAAVQARLRERCGHVPAEVLVAAICRPAWLVEIEGLAIVRQDNPDLPAF